MKLILTLNCETQESFYCIQIMWIDYTNGVDNCNRDAFCKDKSDVRPDS